MNATSMTQFCEAVHQELDRLALFCSPPSKRSDVPRDGIYFWYEAGEVREGGKQRVTRVGTHEKPGRLHGRIREHYGSNREGSALRKHLGGALMVQHGEPQDEIEEWYRPRKTSSRFKDLKFEEYEVMVSGQAKLGAYRALQVVDSGLRASLEGKLIALFGECNHCLPSTRWLGRFAYRAAIRQSGLWNVEYVGSPNTFAATDLLVIRELVDRTL